MKWSKEELQEHIRVNVWSVDKATEEIHGYGAAIVAAALYEKLYGERPRIGLSGYQAGAVDSLIEAMPDTSQG